MSLKIFLALCIAINLISINSAQNEKFTCRTGCKICDPMMGGTCLRCHNNMWGDSCQNKCQCPHVCDVDTGVCMATII